MPLVNCPTCQAGLKVPDGMAGRKARCNKCQNVFAIPATAATVAAPPMPGPPAAPRPGGPPPRPGGPPPRLPMPPAHGGPPPMAPGPHRAPPPPGYGPPPVGQYPNPGIAPGARPAPAHAPDPFADNGEPRRKKKKKGGPPVLLLSLIGGGALLLILLLVILFIWLFWGSSGPGGDLAYMPDDSTVITSVQVRSLVNSGAWKALKDDMGLEAQLIKEAKGKIGITGDDITSILAGGKDQHPGAQVFAVRTSKGYTADEIINNVNIKDNTETVKAGTHTITKRKDSDSAFCVINSNLIIYGSSDALKKVLDRNGQPKLSDDMRAAMGSVSFSSTMAVAADMRALEKQGKGGNPFGPMGAGFSMPQNGGFEVNVSSTITVRGSATFKDSKAAEDMATMAKGFITMGQAMASKEQKDMLNALQISTSGSRLNVSVSSIDPASLKGMKGGGMMGGGPMAGGFLPNLGGPPIFVPPPPGGGGGNTPLPNITHKRSGSFADLLSMKSNDIYNYQITCKGGFCSLTLRPQFDAKANIFVRQNGVVVAQDADNQVKTNFLLTWNAAPFGVYDVQIISTDNLLNHCQLSFSDGGVPAPAAPPFPAGGNNPGPIVGGPATPILANIPVTGNVFKGGAKLYSVNLQAGKQCTISCNTLQAGYDPYIWLINPTGQVVAQDDDSGGFPNARIIYTPFAPGNYQIKVGSFGNGSGGNFNLTVQQ